MTTDIVERLRASLEMSHHLQLRYEAAAEIERLRTLARDAYEAWDNDRDSKVGKLLRAMLDGKFCATYRPDLPHNTRLDDTAAAIAALRAQLAEAQRDSERLDWMIEQCAYVVSDPDCCDGYWLNYPRKDGTMWTQATEHETPRAAIDAAKGENNG